MSEAKTMPLLRLLFFILLALNLLAFAAARGWLGTSDRPGEPERLANQLDPARIVLQQAAAPGGRSTPPAASTGTEPDAVPQEAPAPQAEAETQACVAIVGLGDDDAASFDAALRAQYPGLEATPRRSSTTSAWWVQIPPAASKEAAERRIAGIRALGITDLFMIQEPGPQRYAISLGLFKTESGARQHMQRLEQRGVRGAVVAPRTAETVMLEVRGPEGMLQSLRETLASSRPGAAFDECAR